jgi:hypothetical protein
VDDLFSVNIKFMMRLFDAYWSNPDNKAILYGTKFYKKIGGK